LHCILGVDLDLVEGVLDDLNGHGWFADELSIGQDGRQTIRTVTPVVPSLSS
jgi:hypothetical protein